jgi:hypothetical protein
MLGYFDAYCQIVVPWNLECSAQIDAHELCIIEKQIISIYIVAIHAPDCIYNGLPECRKSRSLATANVCHPLGSNN